jgi:hypothetical protein
MTFEFRKISDVGTGHPVVARLGVQASEFTRWLDIEDARRKEVADLYVRILTERLLRCHQFREDLVIRVNNAVQTVQAEKDKRIREVPNVIAATNPWQIWPRCTIRAFEAGSTTTATSTERSCVRP